MTPPELSPAKAYGEWKFNPGYDFGSVSQGQSNNSLLFETDPLRRYHDVGGITQHPAYGPVVANNTDPFQASARAFASFEPFSERVSAPSSECFPRLDSIASLRQGTDPSLLHPSWGHQRVRTSSADWVKADERRAFEFNGMSEGSLGSPSGSRSLANAHEVSICAMSAIQPLLITIVSPSTSCPFYTPLRRRHIIYSSRVSSSHPTSKHLSFCNKSSKSPTVKSAPRSLTLSVLAGSR